MMKPSQGTQIAHLVASQRPPPAGPSPSPHTSPSAPAGQSHPHHARPATSAESVRTEKTRKLPLMIPRELESRTRYGERSLNTTGKRTSAPRRTRHRQTCRLAVGSVMPGLPAPARRPPSAHRISWQLLRPPPERRESEAPYLWPSRRPRQRRLPGHISRLFAWPTRPPSPCSGSRSTLAARPRARVPRRHAGQ